MKLYLLRHGHRGNGEEQDWLTEIGVTQAQRAAQYFLDKKIDKIICGDAQRARKTGDIIQERIHCIIEYTPLVNEQSLGSLQGKTKKEWEEAVTKAGVPEKEFRPEKGENRQDAYERAKQFVGILKREKTETILVISHAGFIADVITLLHNLPEHENVHYKTGFGALTTFELDRDFQIQSCSIGELKHLIPD